MRNLANSILSFSWAMSLFGARQAANVLSPDKAVRSVNHVTEAATDELGETLTAAFDVGDKVQKGLVDLTAKALKAGGVFDPSGFARAAADLGRKTAQSFGDANSNK